MFDYDDDNEGSYEAGSVLSPEEIKWGRRFTISWDHFEDNVKIFPQHAEQARAEIERHMGYMPLAEITFRHEPFIRALIEEHKQGRLNQKEFDDAVAVHARHVRNDHMQRGGWAAPYTEENYHLYDTHLVQFKDQARKRLLKNLDPDLPLEYTLDAELMLRDLFTCDVFSDEKHALTDVDCRAFTILFYRMSLIEDGREVANEIALMGLV